jgi:hypothetical protein
MLNNYQNEPRQSKKAAKLAAAQVARKAAAEVQEPITTADLLACIEEYNQTEAAAHELRRVIFEAVTRRSGYKLIRVGPHTFNGSPEALAAMESGDPARLIKVESLGGE